MPLRNKSVKVLQDKCKSDVFDNLLKICNVPNFGRRFIDGEETRKDTKNVKYICSVPPAILRTLFDPLIESMDKSEDLVENIYPFLFAKQPEHLTMAVHGEHFGDIFSFVYKNGQYLTSIKLMTSSDAPPPSDMIKQIMHNMENLETFEFECARPFVEFCPYFLKRLEDGPMLPLVKNLRFLKVEDGLCDEDYANFADSIGDFLIDHPLTEFFTFEHEYPIVTNLMEKSVVLPCLKKLELEYVDLNESNLSSVVKIFPNVVKIKMKAENDSLKCLCEMLNLENVELTGKFSDTAVLVNDHDDDDYEEREIDTFVHLDVIKQNISSFKAVVAPFLLPDWQARKTAVKSLHLSNYYGVDLKLINSACPHLKCLKLFNCTIANSPTVSDLSADDLPFKELQKLTFTTADAVFDIKEILIRCVRDKFKFPYFPNPDDFKYMLAGAVDIRSVHLKPCCHFDDDVMSTVLKTNRLVKLDDLTLELSIISNKCIMDLLSMEEHNLHKIRLPCAIGLGNIEKMGITQAAHDLDVDIVFDSAANNPYMRSFQHLMSAAGK